MCFECTQQQTPCVRPRVGSGGQPIGQPIEQPRRPPGQPTRPEPVGCQKIMALSFFGGHI